MRIYIHYLAMEYTRLSDTLLHTCACSLRSSDACMSMSCLLNFVSEVHSEVFWKKEKKFVRQNISMHYRFALLMSWWLKHTLRFARRSTKKRGNRL